ncbi:hypothetical protein SAMN04487906_2193 [Zhouia amylolytica]|uniref:Peptidase family M50 n=1 Tax=Zhouia amylolytica TaxID=376730 RepID=A0A1I6TWS2_9FLAO|nr:hypothetical protein [Zhouia amylolytica]SFS93538.1 hypothetical protein SAMN04487906_2193 [Zhouia amylolytica]
MTDTKITAKYVLASAGAVLFTWLIHEFTHWVTSEALGYEAIMTLNTVSPLTGQEQTDWHKIYISASGPLITILQALIVFMFLLKKGWNKLVYPLLFTPLYMRVMAGFFNFIKPNDEGRVSDFFGLGLFTLSIIVSAILFFLVYRISKKHQLNWKFNILTLLVVIFFSSILIMADQFLGIRIL